MTQHIFLSELDAMVKGAGALTPTDRATAQYNIDNSTLHYVVRRGLSGSYAANCRLRAAFGRSWPKSKWISTKVMPVDAWSRGVNVPNMPCPIDATFRAGLQAATQDGLGT